MKGARHQLWRKIETAEGTVNAPTVAEAAYAADVDEQPDYQEFDLARVASSIDKEATLIGQKRWTISYALDFKGGGASGGVPQLPEWDPDLRMCGAKVTQCYYVTGGAITGTIAHGETFTQATSGATGKVIGAYSGTPTRFHYEATSGTLDASHTVTCSGGATFTPGSTPTAHGFKYSPVTDQWSLCNRTAWTGSPSAGEVMLSDADSTGIGLLLDSVPPNGSAGQIAMDVLLGSFASLTQTALTAGASAGSSVTLSVTAGTGPNFASATVVVGFGSANAEVCTVTGTAANTITVATLANSQSSGATVCKAVTITGASSGATCTLLSTLAQTHNASGSIFRLVDGKLIGVTGARGNWQLPLKGGEPIQIKFTQQGFQYAVTTSLLGAATYSSSSRATQRFVAANFTLDGKAFFLSKLEIDGGNKLGIRPDANALEGAISYRINDREPQVTLDPEDLPPAAYDFLAKAAASTLVACKVRMGTTEALLHSESTSKAGTILWIDLPNIQYGPPKRGNRDGTVTAEIAGKLRRGSAAGDDSWAIYSL